MNLLDRAEIVRKFKEGRKSHEQNSQLIFLAWLQENGYISKQYTSDASD